MPATTRRIGMRRGSAVLAVLLLASCVPGPRVARSPATQAPAAPLAPATGTPYVVDPARSELRILTFRAGPLARLGHSHVLISRDLRGTLHVPEDASATTLELEMPVASLALDEPAARAAEGDEFASVPTEDDRSGTRRNLLGPQVLDADRFPAIRVTAAGASGGPADYVLHSKIELRGTTTPLDVAAHVVRDAGELVATGEFRVTQSALGLTPFSVAFGALQVRDELVVRFRIVAARPAT